MPKKLKTLSVREVVMVANTKMMAIEKEVTTLTKSLKWIYRTNRYRWHTVFLYFYIQRLWSQTWYCMFFAFCTGLKLASIKTCTSVMSSLVPRCQYFTMTTKLMNSEYRKGRRSWHVKMSLMSHNSIFKSLRQVSLALPFSICTSQPFF